MFKQRLFNLPNAVTLARLTLGLLSLYLFARDVEGDQTSLGLVLFVTAVALDGVDGHVARRFNCVTDFGKIADPLVDKIVLDGLFVCLVHRGALESWLAFAAIFRDLFVQAVRSVAASKGSPLRTFRLGDSRYIVQAMSIAMGMLATSPALASRPGLINPLRASCVVLFAVGLALGYASVPNLVLCYRRSVRAGVTENSSG